MQSAFDPYYRWLGIAPDEQPPDHYRLLGLRPFESDPGVIEMAADRQMRHLQTFKMGPNSAHSQTLLNEVAAARLCLLSPARKTAYDASLKSAQPAPPPVNTAVAAPPVPLINTTRGPTAPIYRHTTQSAASSSRTLLAVAAAAIGVFAATGWLVWRSQPTRPALLPIANQELDEGQTLTLELASADRSQPGASWLFDLLGGSPWGVKLDRASGALSWTPDDSHGPGTHTIGVRASVAGSPHLFDEVSFEVVVKEIHQPPHLEHIELRPAGRTGLSTLLRGRDLDQPRGKLVYSVQVVPPPANPPTLNSDSGQFVWRPAVEDLAKSFQLTFRVAKAGLPQFFSEQVVNVPLPAVSDSPPDRSRLKNPAPRTKSPAHLLFRREGSFGT